MIYTAIINFSFGVNMLLQVEKATFSYGGSPLFKDISFSVNEGRSEEHTSELQSP